MYDTIAEIPNSIEKYQGAFDKNAIHTVQIPPRNMIKNFKKSRILSS